jgi:anti-sigma B factor antagonist
MTNETYDFVISVERDQAGVQVRIVGALDLSRVPELNDVLDGLAADGHRRLVLDLGAVDFMDSRGLAALLRAKRSADRDGHRLTISSRSPQVQRLLELTGMLDQFTFE